MSIQYPGYVYFLRWCRFYFLLFLPYLALPWIDFQFFLAFLIGLLVHRRLAVFCTTHIPLLIIMLI